MDNVFNVDVAHSRVIGSKSFLNNATLQRLTTANFLSVIHNKLPFLIWSSFNPFSRNSCRENTMKRKKWGKVGHLKDPLTKTVFILMY